MDRDRKTIEVLFLISSGLTTGALIAFVSYFYYILSRKLLTTNQELITIEKFAQFGDSFGVATAVFTALITFLTFIITYYAKSAAEAANNSHKIIEEGLKLQTQESERIKGESQKSLNLQNKQAFEGSIANLINTKDEILKSIKTIKFGENNTHINLNGYDAVHHQLSILKHGYKIIDDIQSNNIKQCSRTFFEFKNQYENSNRLISQISIILKLISNSKILSDDEKQESIGIFKQQLSQSELELMFFQTLLKTSPTIAEDNTPSLDYDFELIGIARNYQLFESYNFPAEYFKLINYSLDKTLIEPAFGHNPKFVSEMIVSGRMVGAPTI